MMNRRGFTLVEAIMAIGIFAIAAVMASSVLLDISQIRKTTSIQNSIYEDTRIILQMLSNEIQGGAIDYEEYYGQNVLQWDFYGINYGVYGSRFFNPGRTLAGARGENPSDLGIECSRFAGDGSCEIYLTNSGDTSTGQNPFCADSVSEQTVSDAFCGLGIDCDTGRNVVDELLLIDSTGTQKTIIGLKKITVEDNAIGVVRMVGEDTDQNGIIDLFTCHEDYNCSNNSDYPVAREMYYPFVDDAYLSENNITVPINQDKNALFNINSTQFLPISPLRADIQELKFIINPLEDPYKAFAEEAVQSHPSVTIMLTVGLASAEAEHYPGEFEPITVQTTVSAGVLTEINSYPPITEILGGGDSWVRDATVSEPSC